MNQEEISDELYAMCLAKKKRPFQDENRPRVRELGSFLYEIGGHDLMCDVRDQMDECGSDLDFVWRGIGEWG